MRAPHRARVRVHLPRRPAAAPCGGRLAVRGYLRPPRAYRNGVRTEVGGWSLWVKGDSLAASRGEPDLLSRVAGAARARLFRDPRSRTTSAAGPPSGARAAARRRQCAAGRAAGGDAARRARPPGGRLGAQRRHGGDHLPGAAAAGAARRCDCSARCWASLAYALLVGPLPSLLRALLMAAAVSSARCCCAGCRRRQRPRRSPACCWCCSTLPGSTTSASSSASPPPSACCPARGTAAAARCGALGPLAAPLAVTLAAQLATLPWALAAFGRLSPMAPLANLVAVPWAGVALAAALAWAIGRLLFGAAADVLLPLLDLLARAAGAGWRRCRPAPGSPGRRSRPGRSPGLLDAAAASCALLPRPRWSVAARLGRHRRAAVRRCPRRSHRRPPSWSMLDVGQGDALLLRDGDATLLVDGGGWRRPGFGGRVLLPALAALGIRSLDALAVTHPDSDHCGGAADLLRELPVGEVWAPPGIAGTPCGAGAAGRPARRYRELAAGDGARVGRWRLRVLGPSGRPAARTTAARWCCSPRRRGAASLLTGDLDAAGEAALLAPLGRGGAACDLLKVAPSRQPQLEHRAASCAPRSPRLALISVGAGNPYGHPSPKVLGALERQGVPVLRTDRDGMVRVQLGRGAWRIATGGAPEAPSWCRRPRRARGARLRDYIAGAPSSSSSSAPPPAARAPWRCASPRSSTARSSTPMRCRSIAASTSAPASRPPPSARRVPHHLVDILDPDQPLLRRRAGAAGPRGRRRGAGPRAAAAGGRGQRALPARPARRHQPDAAVEPRLRAWLRASVSAEGLAGPPPLAARARPADRGAHRRRRHPAHAARARDRARQRPRARLVDRPPALCRRRRCRRSASV